MKPESWKRSLPHEVPLKNLTWEEWRLLIAAVAAYQHNSKYQTLHMKLLAQHSLSREISSVQQKSFEGRQTAQSVR